MNDHDASVKLANAMVKDWQQYLTDLTAVPPVVEPPPVIDPPPVVTPPPVTTGRQPVLAWIGTFQAHSLPQTSALAGVVVSSSDPESPVNADLLAQLAYLKPSGMILYGGCYLALAMSSWKTEWVDRIKAYSVACSGKLAFDPEAYPPVEGSVFNGITAADSYHRGFMLGNLGSVIIYMPSGQAGWPGCYNDAVQVKAHNPGAFTNNRFADFVDGMVAAGTEVILTDASFHAGPQISGSWETDIAQSVAAVNGRFPKGVKASVMLWPDNDEARGPYSPADMHTAFEAATRLCTGPVIMYQHTLHQDGAAWAAWLAAIKAAQA